VNPVFPVTVGLAAAPRDLVLMTPILGDGNCLFRTVAERILGDEHLHGIVRQKAVAEFRKNNLDFVGGTDLLLDQLRIFFQRKGNLQEFHRLVDGSGAGGYCTTRADYDLYLSTPGAGWANTFSYQLVGKAYPDWLFRYWMPCTNAHGMGDFLIMYLEVLDETPSEADCSSGPRVQRQHLRAKGRVFDPSRVVNVLWDEKRAHFSLLWVEVKDIVWLHDARTKHRANLLRRRASAAAAAATAGCDLVEEDDVEMVGG
jgi:hypothetical protein